MMDDREKMETEESLLREEQEENHGHYSFEGSSPPRVKGIISFRHGADTGHWVDVISSNVAAIRYDREWSTLSVRFNNGRSYEYMNVPAHLAEDLFESSSMGRFLAKRIKGMYSTRGPF
jgi:hypothetical protein